MVVIEERAVTAAHHRRHVGHRNLAGQRENPSRRDERQALRQRLGHQRDACRGTGADRPTDQERATKFIMLQRNGYRNRGEFSGKAKVGQALEQTICLLLL